MEENSTPIETLLEKAAEYGKSSFELIKLKALEKTVDVTSTIIPSSIFLYLIASFMLFVSFGASFLIGEMFGKIFYGFFIIAGFYLLTGIIINFFLHKWIKKIVGNYIIKKALK